LMIEMVAKFEVLKVKGLARFQCSAFSPYHDNEDYAAIFV